MFFRVGERFVGEGGEFAGHGSVSEEGGVPARFVLRGWRKIGRLISLTSLTGDDLWSAWGRERRCIGWGFGCGQID